MLYDRGWLIGRCSYDEQFFSALGSLWDKPSLNSLDGAECSVFGLGADKSVGFGVKASGSGKITAESTEYTKEIKAKISATKSTGVFKGSFKYGSQNAKFEGALYIDPNSGKLVGVGGGYVKGDVFFSVEIVPLANR